MTNPVTVRRGGKEDFDIICRLWQKMMDYHKEFDPRFAVIPEGQANFRKYLKQIIERDDYLTLVAETEGRVVGYMIGAIFDNPELFIIKRYGFVAEIYVEVELRGRGVGEQLFEKMRRWFSRHKITVFQLNVSYLNKSGINFWKKLGFRDFLQVLWYDTAEQEKGK